jgi:hypothetical protein
MKRPLPATLAVSAALAVCASLVGCRSQAPQNPRAAPTNAASAQAAQVPPSWNLDVDQSASAGQAGLPMLGSEMLAVHYHAHIDMLIRGEPVVVPANVGIDIARQKISPLHTHDATGIVHIESAEDIQFTLGQFFTEWGQPLKANGIGPITLAEGEALRVYRDGKLVAGDPAAVTLTKHGEFFIWVGPAATPPSKPVATFTFPKGL